MHDDMHAAEHRADQSHTSAPSPQTSPLVWVQQLEAVHAVAMELSQERNLPALLELIVRQAVYLIEAAQFGVILFWDDATETLIPQIWSGTAAWIGGMRLRLGEGVAGEAARRRQGLLDNDYQHSSYAHALFIERHGTTAVLAEPLLARDRLIGVIVLDNQRTARRFTLQDRELLRLFAAQASIAIENARLFVRVEERTAALEHSNIELRREIAAREEAEKALKESEERYRELVENANDLVYVHDLSGNFLAINKAAERVSGYSREEALRMNIADVIAPEHLELARQMTTQKLAAGGPSTYNLDIVAKDGHRVALEVSSRLMSRGGEPFGVQGIARDTTERQQFETQLRRLQRMEALGTLAGGIAHDFNNVLSAILGYVELSLQDASLSGQVRSHLQQVLTAGGRARELIYQILTFSRQAEQQRRPIRLDQILSEALRLLRASMPSSIEIRQRLSDVTSTVIADATQMHQVFMNLCTNAEYAMRATGGVLEVLLDTIEVEAAFAATHPELQPGPYVRLIVRDTGQGMAPEVQERIFEPFFTTKKTAEGTGMGLAVVHGIVAAHGGAITVSSAPGQGATFTVYLPQVRLHAARSLPAAESIPRGGERLLFVDDEAPLAQLGQAMLERLGYSVAVHTSSVEALEAFRADPQHFDLVITDQTLPHMTGDALSRELRRIRPGIPIILCTGFSHTMTADKARALGIDAFLMKPLSTRELGAVIRRVLDQANRP